MLIYSCDHGHTTVDQWDDRFLDEEKDLEAEINDSWSGDMTDIWHSDNKYERPNIFV